MDEGSKYFIEFPSRLIGENEIKTGQTDAFRRDQDSNGTDNNREAEPRATNGSSSDDLELPECAPGAQVKVVPELQAQRQCDCSPPSQDIKPDELSLNINGTFGCFNNSSNISTANNSNCNRNNNNNSGNLVDSERRYRPQKYCAVCGDKAIACNFNAVTCESCKAFFRRNAFKEQRLKCLFESRCVIDRVTRRFCSKCRLLKCFQIGMKREWILTDEQKQIKKVKIMQNKQSRQQGPAGSPSQSENLASPKFAQGKSGNDSKANASLRSQSAAANKQQQSKLRGSSVKLLAQTGEGRNKFIETKDASTSCPDEFDLLNPNARQIHYCSLAFQCQFCALRLDGCVSSQPMIEYHHHHHHNQHQIQQQHALQEAVRVQPTSAAYNQTVMSAGCNYSSSSTSHLTAGTPEEQLQSGQSSTSSAALVAQARIGTSMQLSPGAGSCCCSLEQGNIADPSNHDPQHNHHNHQVSAAAAATIQFNQHHQVHQQNHQVGGDHHPQHQQLLSLAPQSGDGSSNGLIPQVSQLHVMTPSHLSDTLLSQPMYDYDTTKDSPP